MRKFYLAMVVTNLASACLGGYFAVGGLAWATVWSVILWRSL